MREYPIGVYEKALYKKTLPEQIDEAARLGFDLFEISIDETEERTTRLKTPLDMRKQLALQARDSGIRLFSICFSAQRRFSMGSTDQALRQKSLQMMQEAIGLCCDLGVRVLQVAGYDVYYEPQTIETQKWFEENLEKSACWAEREGVMLAVETVEKHITSVESGMDIIQRIDSPWLTLYPDVANLYMNGCDPVKELSLPENKMTALHMREAPDDGYIPFGRGKLDFDGIFRVLEERKFHGPLIVELWNEDNPAYEKILKDAIYFLEEKSCMRMSGER